MSRRLARFTITPECIVDLLKPRREMLRVIQNALPDDAKVVGIGKSHTWFYDPETHCIEIVVESKSFAEVEEGQILTELPPIILERKI